MPDANPERPSESDATPEQENLCRRCGRCCYEKVRFGEQVVITDIPCRFLDTETNLCTVYPERFSKQPHCTTAEASVAVNALPGDCPYIGGYDGYQEPHFLSEHPEYARAVERLFPGGRSTRQ